MVSTGNSLDFVDADMKIMLEHKTAVKEMEANSIAWVASMFGTPLIALKAVTDIVDGDRPTGEEFLENLHKTVASLTVSLSTGVWKGKAECQSSENQGCAQLCGQPHDASSSQP